MSSEFKEPFIDFDLVVRKDEVALCTVTRRVSIPLLQDLEMFHGRDTVKDLVDVTVKALSDETSLNKIRNSIVELIKA